MAATVARELFTKLPYLKKSCNLVRCWDIRVRTFPLTIDKTCYKGQLVTPLWGNSLRTPLQATAICNWTLQQYKISEFWAVEPCKMVQYLQCFRGPYCLHHQGDNYNNDSKGFWFIKTAAFSEVAPCSVVDIDRRFRRFTRNVDQYLPDGSSLPQPGRSENQPVFVSRAGKCFRLL
jgi:hypothetical protein